MSTADLASPMVAFIVAASLRVSILGAAVALTFSARGGFRSATRHLVWAAVLAAMLLMPLTMALAPPVEWFLRVHGGEPGGASSAFSSVFSNLLSVTGQRRPLTSPGSGSARFGTLALASVYLAGLCVSLLRVVTGSLMVMRLKGRSRGVYSPRLAVARGLVRESGLVSVPVTLGVWRAVIVLPLGWQHWSERKLEAVLRHELAHVKRHDPLVVWLASVNRAAWWFHPLAWWVERQIVSLAEEVADDEVLRTSADRHAYSEHLLEFASLVTHAGRYVPRHILSMARLSHIHRRIDRILDGNRPLRPNVPRLSRIVLAGIGLPLFWLTAAVHVAWVTAGPSAIDSDPFYDLHTLMAGQRLTGFEADKLERTLATSRHDLHARTRLIAHYYLNARSDKRMPHVYWLIRHHPEADAFDSQVTAVDPPRDSGPQFERALTLWLEHADSTDVRTLRHAAIFFEAGGQFHRAERCLTRAMRLDPGSKRTARMLDALYRKLAHASLTAERGW